MRMVIKRISISKFAIFAACLGVTWGIIATALNLLFGPYPAAGVSGTLLLGLPVIGVFAGFFAGALFASVYNLIARFIGGIEIEVER